MTHKEKDKLIEELRTKIEGFSSDIGIFIKILKAEGLLDKYYDKNGCFLPIVLILMEKYK